MAHKHSPPISYLPLGIAPGPPNPTITTTNNTPISTPTVNNSPSIPVSPYSPSLASDSGSDSEPDLETQPPSNKTRRKTKLRLRKKRRIKWFAASLAMLLVMSFVISNFFPAPRRQGIVESLESPKERQR
ncbi:hypothetical protein BDZ91DRAFT_789437 [Kalaharituber pfeilii]|nr:hypothetical protein BDZ91DRAFT_789437 [Kalaharituber pfeilii]